MIKTTRWLDELPLESSERELLQAGKSAQPAAGAIDANWQALCLALGTGAVATGVTSSAIAANSVAGKVSVGSSLALGKAASGGLVVAAVKSLVLGVAVGLTVMGAGTLVERSSHGVKPPQAVAPSPQAAGRRPAAAPSAPVPPPIAAQAEPLATAQPGASATFAAPRAANRPGEPSLSQTTAPADKTDDAASLSQQARELAELKRLIDSGAGSEALRRLDRNFSADATSALSEERDALYVQALDRAQRRAEARSSAQRFLARYPRSPYADTMRRLLSGQ